MLLITQTARADCGDVLKKCDAALTARDKEIQLCRLALTQSTDMNARLSGELDQKNQKLQSPLRNPFIMTTVGVVIGIVVTGLALKGK